MPQDGPKMVPRALLAALGRSWTALGASEQNLGTSCSDKTTLSERSGRDLDRLGATGGDLVPILERHWAILEGS